jgi:Rrf2 family protein
MLISRASQYAISGVLRLASLPPRQFCRVEDLVRGTSAPRHAVAKVLHALAKRRILDSVRGAGGGFRLSPDALDMTLLQIIEAVEGPFESSVAMQRGLCASEQACPLHRLLQPLNDELKRVLGSTRLRDLIAPGSQAGDRCKRESTSDTVEQRHEHEST